MILWDEVTRSEGAGDPALKFGWAIGEERRESPKNQIPLGSVRAVACHQHALDAKPNLMVWVPWLKKASS